MLSLQYDANKVSFYRIYQLEKNVHRPSTATEDAENSPLIRPVDDSDIIFRRALDAELEKICSFYELKELEIYGEVSELLKEEEAFEAEILENNQVDGATGSDGNGRPRASSSDRPRRNSIFRPIVLKGRRASTISRSIDEGLEGVEDSDDDDDENTALRKPFRPGTQRSKSTPFDVNNGAAGAADDMRASTEFVKSIRRSSHTYDDFAEQAFNALYSSGITLKKRAIGLYVSLCELKSFVQLNQTGFKKVCKKYDKIMDRNLKNKYLQESVAPAYPFLPKTIKHIEENILRIERMYSNVVTHGDADQAKKELRLHLREHVVWERNTVWREMIGIERKAQAANMGIRRTLIGADNDPSKLRLQGDDADIAEMKEVSTPVGRVKCPRWLFSSTMFTLVGIITILILLLLIPIMKKVEQQNCLAMLIFVSLLWATEVRQPLNGSEFPG